VTSRPLRRIIFLAGLLAASVGFLGGVGETASAAADAPTRAVYFHGYRVVVPRSWPVFDLSAHPSVCVRFDRHALYLGRPSPDARCPAHVVGRTEAILLEPRAGKVAVTATWRHHRSTVRRALPARLPAAAKAPPARPPSAPSQPLAPRSAIYTGLGFDTCAAPSPAAMSAWGASPYRAVGIYIGGENRGCAQANLSPEWVGEQVAAGWHLIPIYVGLQAPGACSCSAIDSNKAGAQGGAAATAAVGQAQALGIPAGNPIYYDMEAYARGGARTSAVLAFLSAWTSRLHQLGYVSGVYSSSASGISDLVAFAGSGVVEPDDLWIANWNGQRSTDDPYVPSGTWANHQRIHQYQGGHNETHGGVKINIDSNYVDAATADTSAGGPAPFAPPEVECVVPRLKGLRLVEARSELRSANCRVGQVDRPSRTLHNRVLLITRQHPNPGKHLDERAAVSLTLKWRRR
jgi:hypothetical protein